MLVGAVGVLVSQGGQLALGRVWRQADGVLAHGRHAGQQWAVEQLGVQLVDLHAHPAYVVFQLLSVGIHALRKMPGGARQPGQSLQLILGRQGVRALEALQLQPMLQQAHVLIGGDELLAVIATHIAFLHQGLQRGDGRAHAQGFIRASVHHLQQLHGELHVAQAARTQLELSGADIVRDVFNDSATHRLDVGDKIFPLGGAPHQRRQRLHVLLAQRYVARHGPGLEQRLELPGAGPPVVVLLVGTQGAHQRALLTFGAQGRVHLEEHARADVDELAGPARGAGIGGLGHEDHVHVRDVVQLAGATLAHRQHGQARRWLAVLIVRTSVHSGTRHGQRCGQRSISSISQTLPQGHKRQPVWLVIPVDDERAIAIDGGNARQQRAVGIAHRHVRLMPDDASAIRAGLLPRRFHGLLAVIVLELGEFIHGQDFVDPHSAHAVQHRVRHLARSWQRERQAHPLLGVSHNVVSQQAGCAE